MTLFSHIVLMIVFFVLCSRSMRHIMLAVHKHADHSAPIIFKYNTYIPNNTHLAVGSIASVTSNNKKPHTARVIAPDKSSSQMSKAVLTQPLAAIKSEKKVMKKVESAIATPVQSNAVAINNYREVESIRNNMQLHKEIVQKWSPPVGLSHTCCCEISFFVTSSGSVEGVKMTQKSGVAMYDISARHALLSTNMPQWARGKSFTIQFKQ